MYDEVNDLAYCHTCVKGFKEKKLKAAKADAAFVSGVCKRVECTCSYVKCLSASLQQC